MPRIRLIGADSAEIAGHEMRLNQIITITDQEFADLTNDEEGLVEIVSGAGASASTVKADQGAAGTESWLVEITNPEDISGGGGGGGGLTDTELRASAVPMSVATLPLPSGAATATKQDDVLTSLATAVGHLSSIVTALAGQLEVKNDTGNPLGISDAGGTISIDDGGGAITVDGTVTANTGLAQPLTDTQLRATAVPISGTVTANTGLNQPLTDTQLRATPVAISDNNGAISVDDNAGSLTVDDGNGSLTVDSGQLPSSLGQKTTANSLAVTLPSDMAGIAADTELAAAVAASDAMANPTTAPVIAHKSLWDSQAAAWVREPANVIVAASIAANSTSYFNTFDALQYNWVSFTFANTNSATIVIEVSNDGSVWTPAANFRGYSSGGSQSLISTSFNPASTYQNVTGPLAHRYIRLRTSAYGGSAIGVTAKFSKFGTNEPNYLRAVLGDEAGNMAGVQSLSADTVSSPSVLNVASYPAVLDHFGNAWWTRLQANGGGTAATWGLASAARTATATLAVYPTSRAIKGVSCWINVSAIVSSPSITIKIQTVYDGSTYVDLLTTAAITGTGSFGPFTVHPDIYPVANVSASQCLTGNSQIQVVHANSDSITYKLAYAVHM